MQVFSEVYALCIWVNSLLGTKEENRFWDVAIYKPLPESTEYKATIYIFLSSDIFLNYFYV